MSLDLSQDAVATVALESPVAAASKVSRSSGPVLPASCSRDRITPWVQLCREFLACHRRPLNVAIHCLTTPLFLFGSCSLANLVWPMAWAVAAVVYVGAIARMIPYRTLVATTLVVAGIGLASWTFPVGAIAGLVSVMVGYIAQELAHRLTGEATLQSTYADGRSANWIGDFLRHTVLLLPLILATAGRRKQSPLRLFVTRKAVLPITLETDAQCRDLKTIRDWVQREHPLLSQSTHWWQGDLDGEAKAALGRLCNDSDIRSLIRRHHGTGYEVRPVLGMNELYVTGPPKSSSSDTVFYMPHVDGPWSIFPGARLYRCMLAASANAEVTTHFPMVGKNYDDPEGYRLETGTAVAFDFNRELHYITRLSSPTQTEPRVNLKLHFIAYPKALPSYGGLLDQLTTYYDIKARKLFLQTIQPIGVWAKGKAFWVLGWTKAFELIARFAGWSNLAYIALVGLFAAAIDDWRLFAIGTSFVHYMIYAGTLREHSPVAFGEFKRNAMFYKAVSMATLFTLYLASGMGGATSIALVTAGFSLAFAASAALGLNRTYFSAELGFDRPERVGRWPYTWIPHPMVIGSMVGIGGMLISPPFRTEAGWLAAGHLTAYVAILVQEILDQQHRSGRNPTPSAQVLDGNAKPLEPQPKTR